jgi:PAS domain S-box-containing protein
MKELQQFLLFFKMEDLNKNTKAELISEIKSLQSQLSSYSNKTDKGLNKAKTISGEQKFYKLAEASPSAIFIFGKNGIYYVNDAASELVEYTKEEILKMKFWNFLHPDFQEQIKEQGMARLTGASPSPTRIEICLITKEKKEKWIEYATDAIDYEGELAIIGTAIDISEKKAIEQQLRENEEVYRTLFEAATDAVFIMQDEIFIACNDATTKMFLCGKEKIVGRPPFEFSPEFQYDGRPSKVAALEKINLARIGTPQTFEWLHSRYDGTVFDAEVILNSIVVQGITYLQAIVRDITERKKAQEAIKQSEKQFRIIFENAPIGICLTSCDGHFITVNRSLCNMLGYTREELQNRPVADFTHPDDIVISNSKIKQDSSGKTYSKNFIKRYIHKDGHVIWVSISSSLFKDTEGTPKYLIGQILDITDQRKEEEANRLNEARLEALVRLNNLSDRSVKQLTDYALEEVVKLTGSKYGFLAFLSPDESILQMHSLTSEVMNSIFKVRNTSFQFKVNEIEILGEAVKKRETVITNSFDAGTSRKKGLPEGHVSFNRLMNVPIFDGQKIVVLAGVANKETDYDESDIRQLTLLMNGMWGLIKRKKDEEAIIESEERYRLITNNSNDIIVKFGTNGKISFVSPACKKLLGFDAHEMIGQSVFKFFHPDDVLSLREYEKALLEQTASNIVKHRLKKVDGRYIWFETNNQIVLDTDGKIKEVVAVCRDITELLKAESFKKEKEAAELASKAKSEFLANMSHEIRNPLNSIIGLSNTLSRADLNNENKEIVESLKISSGNLLNIINDILDFSKIEANEIRIINNNFEVQVIIHEVYSSFKAIADHKKLDFSYIIEKEVPGVLYGDSGKLKQILINLVSNAIKFTETGFVSIQVKKSKCEKKIIYLKIDIADSGIGIKKEDFGRLFQSFAQLDSSTTKSYSGTGLGLVITSRYANLMNGKVDYISKFGNGSTFTIEIPFRIPSDGKPGKEHTTADIDLSKAKLKILLAEDDGINQLYMKTFLSGKGIEVDTAFNGIQVIEKYESNKYDLILMDGQMPKMDGFEATRIIRKKEEGINLHIPIIAMTGYAVSGDREKFLDTGMDDYISKPIDENKLLEIIRKYIDNSGNSDQA